MKRLTKWTALTLCCAVALALFACAGGPEAPQGGEVPAGTVQSEAQGGFIGAKGAYVETNITPARRTDSVRGFVAQDGTLLCISSDLKRVYTSRDGGESWENEASGFQPSEDFLVYSEDFTWLEDGRVLALPRAGAPDGSAAVLLGADGTMQPFPIAELDKALAEGFGFFTLLLETLPGGRLFVGCQLTPAQANAAAGGSADNDDVAAQYRLYYALIDLESGAVIADLSGMEIIAAAANEDTLYLLDPYGTVTARSLADGKSLPEIEYHLPVGEASMSNTSMAFGAGALYVLANKRVSRLRENGEFETVLDDDQYATASMATLFPHLLVTENGSIILCRNNRDLGAEWLYKYTWDENATANEEQTLRVWALEDNPTVRIAIGEMRGQNPDANIQLEIALWENIGLTAEDAIRALNTRLLGGDGPDVLILDGCPAESYARQGMMLDLSEKVDTSAVLPNLVAPFVTESGLFYMPICVQIPLLLGSEEYLAQAQSLDALAALVKAGNTLPAQPNSVNVDPLPQEQRPVLAPESLEELFNILWHTNAGAIMAGGGLNSDALQSMLECLVTMSDKYALGAGGGLSLGVDGIGFPNGLSARISGAAIAYDREWAWMGTYMANSAVMLQMAMGGSGRAFSYFPGPEDGVFVPVCLVGINAGSSKTGLAAQFVNTMLSDAVQKTGTAGVGFPVTETGLNRQIRIGNLTTEQTKGEAYQLDYATMFDGLHTPYMVDAVVRDMVWATVKKMCAGEMDVEGAVRQLEQNLKNYLAERR